jgi:hypothetical protein
MRAHAVETKKSGEITLRGLMRVLGCFFLVIVTALIGIVSLIYVGGLLEKEWKEARPEGLSDADWAAKRSLCDAASLGAKACGATPTAEVQRAARAMAAKRMQKLCAEDARAEAISEAKSAVKAALKSPSSADFVGASIRTKQEGCAWTVTGEVDAQNSFGAMIRSTFRVNLRRLSDDVWLSSAKIND